MKTPDAGVRPISFEEALREREREGRGHDDPAVEKWIRRNARRYPASRDQLRELRSAGALGALEGARRWEQLPEPERTDEAWRKLRARGVRNEMRAAWWRMTGKTHHQRAATLRAEIQPPDYDGRDIAERVRERRAHLTHVALAGCAHGSEGIASPEELYLERERQEIDRDRVSYAIARLEDPDDRLVAQMLLVQGISAAEAFASIGVREKSQRTRRRNKLLEELRRHARLFASSLGPRRRPPDEGGGTPA